MELWVHIELLNLDLRSPQCTLSFLVSIMYKAEGDWTLLGIKQSWVSVWNVTACDWHDGEPQENPIMRLSHHHEEQLWEALNNRLQGIDNKLKGPVGKL